MFGLPPTNLSNDADESAGLLLGLALQDILPGSHLIKSGATQQGFFCDCQPTQELQPFLLQLIEERLQQLIREDLPIEVREMIPSNAADFLLHHNHPCQAEIAKWGEELVAIAQVGERWTLASPHQLDSTSGIGAPHLLRMEPITVSLPEEEMEAVRITGVRAENKQALKKLLKKRKEQEHTDHRRIGEQMQLFIHHPEMGEGTWIWTPKGEILKRELICWEQHHLSRTGAQWVSTPTLLRGTGPDSECPAPHLEEQGIAYHLARDPSPLHAALFGSEPRPYHFLPLHVAEQRTLYARCLSQDYCGLLRSREQTCHVSTLFCDTQDLPALWDSLLQSAQDSLKILKIPGRWILRGERKNHKSLIEKTNEIINDCEVVQEPNVEVGLLLQWVWKDRIGREWSGGYLHLDPPNCQPLDLRILGADGQHHPPRIIAHSLLGGVERAIGIWLERTEGVLPLWGAPEQLRLLPKEQGQWEEAEKWKQQLAKEGIRVGLTKKQEPLKEKVFHAFEAKVPYIAVMGPKEVAAGKVTLRSIKGEEVASLTQEEVVERLKNEVEKTRGLA